MVLLLLLLLHSHYTADLLKALAGEQAAVALHRTSTGRCPLPPSGSLTESALEFVGLRFIIPPVDLPTLSPVQQLGLPDGLLIDDVSR